MDQSFKKKLSILYNEINKEMFNVGVQSQKIYTIENQALIYAKINRLPVFNMLGEERKELLLSLESAVASSFKNLLKERIEATFNMPVTAVFKDYDPGTGYICTVISFDKTLTK
ncbi:Na-translocating system protein MpsC family protein [Paenibacillus beijingensis]|uniref:Na+-translocating membrane potential-generating system MpsC domain-containing protein n=1 Tax=Paenibacillus beijingensis TaxID=1126833 RepID=A0A0D5NGK7_9BACL|nr:Na-translocating system protein MpsC family protein [Paenibacillus beijingensis]AJY74396.1 hypothetical protein VN24_07170 [Paenibacillus beijingensis]